MLGAQKSRPKAAFWTRGKASAGSESVANANFHTTGLATKIDHG